MHFTDIPDKKVYAFLDEDERLYCVDDTPQEAMWLCWGSPALKNPTLGIYCFGDVTLKNDRTLLITALSDVRMQALLELIRPLKLGTPDMKKQPFSRLEKPIRKPPLNKRSRK